MATSGYPVLVLHLSTLFHSQTLRQLFPYLAFPLKHGIEPTFPPVHIQLAILLLVSLGKGVEIRALLHPPASNLNLLLHACDLPFLIPTVELALLQNMENPRFVSWIPALPFHSRISLEFSSLMSPHHQVFFFFSYNYLMLTITQIIYFSS